MSLSAHDLTTSISIVAILGYLFGSIPFGLVLCKVFGYGDIRKVGSGNIGATNVLRASGSKLLTLLTIALDASKAALAAYVASKISDIGSVKVLSHTYVSFPLLMGLIAGTMAVIGHNFPVWLNFKGGKGVASAFGFILYETPQVALLALMTWIIIAVLTKYSSLSAIIAAISIPLFTYYIYGDSIYLFFYVAIAALVLVRHHVNIKRLIKGEETKIDIKKKLRK